MNIKDIFDKAENGTLTYEQFESATKANGAKFTDLSEGKYVSKSKYDDDILSKDNSITKLNDTITQRDTDLNELRTQLSNAGTDATKLAELQTSLTDLQTKYTNDTAAYQKQLADQRYEFAVKEFASTKQFTSNAAKRDFISSMINKGLVMEGDKIMGAEDFVTTYSENNSDAFVTEKKPENPTPAPQPPKPQFVNPTSSGSTSANQDSKSLFGFEFSTIRKKE